MSASQSSSDLLPKLVVGGIAILAVKALMSSSTGSEPAEAPSSNFDWGWVAEEEANRSFQRALVGCYWDEVGYLTRGYC